MANEIYPYRCKACGKDFFLVDGDEKECEFCLSPDVQALSETGEPNGE